jgi:GNAT superfamily N-acetyltransferase
MAVKLKLILAESQDAEAIASLRNAVTDELTFNHGKGPWTVHHKTADVLADLRNAKLYVALRRDEVIASVTLSAKPTTAGKTPLKSAEKKPLYLTSICIAPEYQRRGYGRACIDEAIRLAKRAKADGIIATTYSTLETSIGEFYLRCGFKASVPSGDHSASLRHYELTP